MNFRNPRVRNVNSIHDRSSQTFRERSRKRYAHEKKDKEHEFSDNQNEIAKAINDRFEYLRTSRDHGEYLVKFRNKETHRIRSFNFQFEDNYEKMRGFWENRQS